MHIDNYYNNILLNNKKFSNCIEIPNFIKCKNETFSEHKIPKNIIQTYKHNFIHEKIDENIKYILNLNPEFNYIFINDNDAKQLIIKYFG
jgi:mannosyltransferase OCH1-like enzyme